MYEHNYLAQHLRKASINHEQDIFAESRDAPSMSYGELFSGAELIATNLQAMGLQTGDRVAVQAKKSLTVIQLYLGVILAGGVYLPLNTDYTATEVDYFLGNARPVFLVCDPAKYESLIPVATDAGVKNTLTLDSEGEGSLVDALKVSADELVKVPRGKNDLAAILYTSGTTGLSKGAMLSHGALASNALVLADYWQFSRQDVLIHALPIFHTHGLFVATNIALIVGCRLIFMPRFSPDAIIEAMPKATSLMGVPTFYTRLLMHPKLTEALTSNMRLFISGSAPMLTETHEQWQQITGHTILERYGMTETNMNTSNPYEGERRIGTVGFALPGVDLRLTDSDCVEVSPGEIGSIEVRGLNVFSGYWQMPEKTRQELREDGWFITGDLGCIDAEGYLSIVGRSKDLIISGGFNIYPKEIESLIDRIDGVLESAVIGIADDDFGEKVIAVVVAEPDQTTSAELIQNSLSSLIAKFKQPRQIHFVDALPRNAMGKVQKNQLRETFSA